MSNPVLLWVDMAWIICLGFLALVMWREHGLVSASVDSTGVAVRDGPAIGSLVPREARGRPDRLLLFLFGDCAPCHEVASRLNRLPAAMHIELAVSDGVMHGSSKSVLELLPARPAFRVLSGEDAERSRSSFGINSGPFAVAIRHDMVAAKGYLRSDADVLRLSGVRRDLELIDADNSRERR